MAFVAFHVYLVVMRGTMTKGERAMPIHSVAEHRANALQPVEEWVVLVVQWLDRNFAPQDRELVRGFIANFRFFGLDCPTEAFANARYG